MYIYIYIYKIKQLKVQVEVTNIKKIINKEEYLLC